jgi:hypothetical protein
MHGIHELQKAGSHIEGKGSIIDDLEDRVEGIDVLQLLVGVAVSSDVQVG